MPTKSIVPSVTALRAPEARKRLLSGRRFMTVGEVAKLLKLSPSTVRRMIRDGELRAIKMGQIAGGGHYRVHIGSVSDFIARRDTRAEKAS